MNHEEINRMKENFFWRLRVSEDFEGDEDGRISYKHKRFTMMGADYFMADILESLSEIYSGASGGIIRSTGIDYSKELLELIDEGEKDERFANFLGFLQFLGYSQIKLNKDESVEVESSPTADMHMDKDHEQKKVCYFLSGILTGAAQEIYTEDYNFTETSCLADGDEVCKFERKENAD